MPRGGNTWDGSRNWQGKEKTQYLGHSDDWQKAGVTCKLKAKGVTIKQLQAATGLTYGKVLVGKVLYCIGKEGKECQVTRFPKTDPFAN